MRDADIPEEMIKIQNDLEKLKNLSGKKKCSSLGRNTSFFTLRCKQPHPEETELNYTGRD